MTATSTGTPGAATASAGDDPVERLLAAMTVAEKAGQLHLAFDLDAERHHDEIAAGQVGAGIYSHGPDSDPAATARPLAGPIAECQRVARQESRLGIPLLFGSDVVHGLRTTFPIPLGAAASWDLDLVQACAAQAAREAAASGLALTFAPMVDLSTEQRWGRIGETFGGEPRLAERIGAATVTGLQADGRFAATAKHFCGYGLVQAERDHETLSVGLNALHNRHLRPFRAAVAAGVAAVMVGFHDVDGVAMHSHRALVRGVLKGTWGFAGVVTSDWDGIGQLVHQGVAHDLRDAARQAMLAGIDLDMVSGAYRTHLPGLVAAGNVAPDLLDDAVRRVLRLKLRLGLLATNPPGPLAPPGPMVPPGPTFPISGRQTGGQAAASTLVSHLETGNVDEGEAAEAVAANEAAVASEEAAELARRAAASSMVLLKNSGILPLHRNLGVIHVCGPFATEVGALLGTWVFDGADAAASPAAALAERLGAENLLVSDGGFGDLTVRNADRADVTVAVVGEHPSRNGEDHCLPSADLPVGQLDLLRQLTALGKPLVVVVVTGRPLELRPVLSLADAVLVAWHPGSQGGPALADVLVGAAGPGGRLPMGLPRLARPGMTGTAERPTGRRLGRSRDANFGRFFSALDHPELSLGFGLAYTTFAYSELELSRDTLPVRGGVVRASVAVANTGRRPGREVVQLYLRDLVADVVRPVIELADWRLVDLEPGRSTKVTFKITADLFGYWDRDLTYRVDPGDVDVIIGPNSARGSSARVTITS